MNQEKIGKFIAMCRKEKNLTQKDFGILLGVTEKAISNWENGRNMPDLSLFKPICDTLNITVNELLSGEKITREETSWRYEENIVNTLNYSNQKLNKYNIIISLVIIIFGLFILLTAIMIFPSESSWGSIYSLVGSAIAVLGISRFLKKMLWYIRLLIQVIIFSGIILILVLADFINVKLHHEAPMFRIKTVTTGDVIYYDALFYDVYRCYFDEENEIWNITKNSTPTIIELIDYCQ